MRESQSDLPSIAGHEVIFESPGVLKPWTSWRTALEREMSFYRQCPLDHGYPRFVCETFLDADWNPSHERTDIIPATQNGLGILSYLKYYDFTERNEAGYLETAKSMGDYLLMESLTPDSGVFPRFTRSTGRRNRFPQPADAGSQSDRPFEIEPDKGGIAGFALALLSQASGDPKYLEQALHNARQLAKFQGEGHARSSPFPFRVDYRDGTPRGPISGNMTFVLRLYDALLSAGFAEFAAPRAALWRWIKTHQIPNAATDGSLFAQFFEDHDTPTNRSAWAPLNLARYLLERREALEPDWLADADALVEFTRDNFTHTEFGIRVCHEQDEDHQAWGGINSTYGAVLAMCAKASGSSNLAREARAALNYSLFLIDEQGRPRDVFTNQSPGGWQEDAHTDVIHNFIDAMRAFPAWAE
jgi:hypothetical protein